MSERVGDHSASEWDWISAGGGMQTMGCVMFARGVSPERVIEAFGMDPDTARLLPASRANEALSLPVGDEVRTIHPWMRAGRTGEWSFAIDQSALDIVGYHNRIARQLSAGTDLAMLQWTPTIDNFHYLVDGTEVTSFEPLGSFERFGTEPDRFVPAMREVGLPVNPPDPDASFDEDDDDPRILTLQMLTVALGIRLPADVALGPLLTVQRGDPVPPGY